MTVEVEMTTLDFCDREEKPLTKKQVKNIARSVKRGPQMVIFFPQDYDAIANWCWHPMLTNAGMGF